MECYICKQSVNSTKQFFYHLRSFHNISSSFSKDIQCAYKDCSLSLQSAQGIRKHMKTFHNEPSVAQQNDLVLDTAETEICDGSVDINQVETPHDCVNLGVKPTENVDEDNKNNRLFIESIKNTINVLIGSLNSHQLPSTTMNSIVSTIHTLLSSICLYIRANFLPSDISVYKNFVSFQNEVLKYVDDFSTTYKRRKIAFSNVPMPKEIILGQRIERKFDKKLNTYIECPTVDKFMYLSVIENLKYLCKNPDFQTQLLNVKPFNSNVMCDISDGQFIRNNDLHSSGKVTLKIQIYVDEFEPVNGMGYKTNIHKTTALYYIIRNISPLQNSKLKNIHLMGLAYSADVKKYGYNHILQSFVSEIKTLETEGFSIDFIPGQTTLNGSLVAISADNLGANSMLGFVESFSAHNYCRQCLTEKSNVNNVVSESQTVLRNISNYNEHLSLLHTQPIVHGIKHSTILNELKYFHILNAPTVDIMHDILEGVAQWRMAEFFEYIVNQKFMSQQQINEKIAAFNFGYLEKTNLPNSITFDKVTVGLKAAQSWCLIRHLPLIFIDLFKLNNPELQKHCNLIRLLLQSMLCIFAPKISIEMINNLQDNISEMLLEIRKLFPERNIKPKEHFLIHYPRVIREMGPLVHLWCMRFEAKHLYFKKLAQSVQNFVNICKTFLFRHQEYVHFINSIPLETITFKNFSCNESFDFSCYNTLLSTEIKDDIKFVKSVTCSNEKFIKHLLFQTATENNLPVFEEIIDIFMHNDHPYFIVDRWKTLKLNPNVLAFEIEKQENRVSVIRYDEALCHLPFARLMVSNQHFIVPKYTII